jgi:hypothetical protein
MIAFMVDGVKALNNIANYDCSNSKIVSA